MNIRSFLSYACFLAPFMLVPLGQAHSENILPTGGNIVAGSGSISQSDGSMTVKQTTDRMAVDWQGFSIGSANSVAFDQPSTSSVALNRVLGSDPSVIEGRLTSNGHVFLVNPNGVLFTKGAQVNTGGLVASTLSLSNEDFMNGNYTFEGASSNAVINQGNIVAAEGGTVALIAAHIENTGNMAAPKGNVLLGAGNKVALDMGGSVKIQVEKAEVETLIKQGGIIQANGGVVYMTAKAANELTSSVINHTGITEAQTLSTDKSGQIYLIGDKTSGTLNLAGTLDARALGEGDGDGGFIETSAATVNTDDSVKVMAGAANGSAGKWLVDPTNITINAATCSGTNCMSASVIEGALNGGTDVTIQTDSLGADSGNITVNAPISWSRQLLTLSAANSIFLRGTLTASRSEGNYGRLALEYGQGTANGGSSTYSFGTGAKLYIPYAGAFTWKKGSAGATNNLVFDNGLMRFGNGWQPSLTTLGQLEQPWYNNGGSWYKLTWSSYPLDFQVGEGGDGSVNWNTSGSLLSTYGSSIGSSMSGQSFEISGFKEGIGTIVSSADIAINEKTLKLTNSYTLASGSSYLKTVTSLKNLDEAGTATNVRIWVGTRDDYVGDYDSIYKTRGNLSTTGFEAITDTTQQAKALKLQSSLEGDGTAVLFYSTSPGAETSINSCCSFSNATNTDPRNSAITLRNDGSYALYVRLSDLAPGRTGSMTWYYAASSVVDLSEVVSDVLDEATPPEPIVEAPSTPLSLLTAVRDAQTDFGAHNGLPQATFSGSFMLVNVPSFNGVLDLNALAPAAGGNGFEDLDAFKVFVVNGGIHAPDESI